jgi:hypothetical protein
MPKKRSTTKKEKKYKPGQSPAEQKEWERKHGSSPAAVAERKRQVQRT